MTTSPSKSIFAASLAISSRIRGASREKTGISPRPLLGEAMGFRATAVAVALIVALSGCAATWSTANVERAPDAETSATERREPTQGKDILITEQDITDRAYKVLADLEVTVNKTTIFHKNPTRELVADKLREEAAKIGADAVILVRYGTVGIGLMSWGSLEGRGRAIAFAE